MCICVSIYNSEIGYVVGAVQGNREFLSYLLNRVCDHRADDNVRHGADIWWDCDDDMGVAHNWDDDDDGGTING